MRECDDEPKEKGEATVGEKRRGKTAYIDHPVGDLTHTEPSRLTQLFFLILTGVRVVRMTVEPILKVVRHWFREFSPLAFRPLGHGGSRGGKRRDWMQRMRVFGSVGE